LLNYRLTGQPTWQFLAPLNMINDSLEEEFDDEGPSKSEIKRQMLARQDLAKTLSQLSSDAIKSLPVDDKLKEKLLETEKIRTFGAIKRHTLYLGKLMRGYDDQEIALIQARLDALQGVNKAEIARMHYLEQLRDDLLHQENRLTELIAQHPHIEIQELRTLIRNAKKEKELNKPPKAYREIFQLLKSLDI
jgi:ribosome-associated protein